MNSRVIKCVAGSGKTTYSRHLMRRDKNGLYIAYTNRVVNEMRNAGLMSKTIDSLFQSYIIPKFIRLFPLVSNDSSLAYTPFSRIPTKSKAIAKISVDAKDGTIVFGGTRKNYGLYSSRKEMLEDSGGRYIKMIFSEKRFIVTDMIRERLSELIINKYPDELLDILRSRFKFIIIDEAQDLKGYREKFTKLLYDSDIKTVLLGDENQNIMGGGRWFEYLQADENNNQSHRCSEDICAWIRNNLRIEIFGDKKKSGTFRKISYDEVKTLDNSKRTLLYPNVNGENGKVVKSWSGRKLTIGIAKGLTIDEDIVVIGKTLNRRNFYTALTRTTKSAYCTVTVAKTK